MNGKQRAAAFVVGITMAVLNVYLKNQSILSSINGILVVAVPILIGILWPTMEHVKNRYKLIAAIVDYIEDTHVQASNIEKKNMATRLYKNNSKYFDVGPLGYLSPKSAIDAQASAVKRARKGAAGSVLKSVDLG